MASLIMAVLFVAALSTVSNAKTGQYSATERMLGQQLGLDLMNEILARNYQTVTGQAPFSLEPAVSTTVRAGWTNVDDYNNLSDSPPSDTSGNPLAGGTGWTRTVTVSFADSNSLAAVSATANTGVKIITVTVLHGARTSAVYNSYRTSAWINTIPTPSNTTGNQSPVAVVTASPTSGPVGSSGLATNLDASASTDPDLDTLSYTWVFGDGATGSGATVSHTYTAVGTYNAVVTVYDGRGGLSAASVTLKVIP